MGALPIHTSTSSYFVGDPLPEGKGEPSPTSSSSSSSLPERTLREVLEGRYAEQPCLSRTRTFFGSALHYRRPPQGLVIENYLLSGEEYEDIFPKPKLAANLAFQGPASRRATRLDLVYTVCERDAHPVPLGRGEGGPPRAPLRALAGGLRAENEDGRHAATSTLYSCGRSGTATTRSTRRCCFACRVRSLMADVKELLREPDARLPPRPAPWNETQAGVGAV